MTSRLAAAKPGDNVVKVVVTVGVSPGLGDLSVRMYCHVEITVI